MEDVKEVVSEEENTVDTVGIADVEDISIEEGADAQLIEIEDEQGEVDPEYQPAFNEEEGEKIAPVVRCVISDLPDGSSLVGGSANGCGFVIRTPKEEDDNQSTPYVLNLEGCASVEKICIDTKEDGDYEILLACTDTAGCVNLVRCNKELSMLNAITINSNPMIISSFSVWNEEILIGVMIECGTATEGIFTTTNVSSLIVRATKEFKIINCVEFSQERPTTFTVDNAGVLVSKITCISGFNENLFIAGYEKNAIGESYGFVAILGSDFGVVKSAVVGTNDSHYTTIEASVKEGDKIRIIGTCIPESATQLLSFTNVLDQDLNIINPKDLGAEQIVESSTDPEEAPTSIDWVGTEEVESNLAVQPEYPPVKGWDRVDEVQEASEVQGVVVPE